ncbi:MAG: carbamoyltransferase HypF [Spirochaetaceae bacterium]|jgi:hydrogenase maturation protein HypF|nr:carbamoyltransferase HypF [Spirochaetaceae bacterium]
MSVKRLAIEISGIVQGVGFRPTVYKYALECKLTGLIKNTISGVYIEIQGADDNIHNFITQLHNNPPKSAVINSFETDYLSNKMNEGRFEILFSENTGGSKSAGISPDLATCSDCVDEIFKKDNRRNFYAFTNCTNCGPRFTIIKDRPYDRKYTSMSIFPLCKSCENEYNDPLNRRFHAQPNACADCGPELLLLSGEKQKGNSDPIRRTAEALIQGKIALIKGLGGFHISCDPFNNETLSRLRINKDRPNKSFALMMKDIDQIKKFCIVSSEEKKALTGSQAPIVLLKKKDATLDHISPDNNYLGVMLPFTPIHHLLMSHIPLLIMTSANKRDEPLIINNLEAEKLLEERFVDLVLTHNREIFHRCDDSIIQFSGENRQFIRRSRGFVPNPIIYGSKKSTPSLSLGANIKNTFALRKGDRIFLSQHMGDLMDYRNFIFQHDEIKDFALLLDIQPDEIICDAHKGYENYRDDALHVYHHHAHMLSVIAEYDLKEPDVIGVICDGTGYGTDGSIWGFEFLTNSLNNKNFDRLAHLEYFPLPGGEKAIGEIDRIAIALTKAEDHLPFPEERIKQIRDLIRTGLNSPLTSSLGRLFDGIAALTGLISKIEYEARGAILLQKEAELILNKPKNRYTTQIIHDKNLLNISYKLLIKEILIDMDSGISIGIISWKFHKWISDSIISVLRNFTSKKVILSGGCFQNLLLTEMVTEALIKNKYKFYLNKSVPSNDGGIALGQAIF